jgi:hypothetical protein
MILIGVDPGLNGSGFAVKRSDEDHIRTSGTVRCKDKEMKWCERAHDISIRLALNAKSEVETAEYTILLLEYPEVGFKSKAGIAAQNSGALLKLSYLCGCISRDFALLILPSYMFELVLVPPSKWKGQLGKHVVMARLLRKYGKKFHDHEADAVGIVTSYENGWKI